MSANSGHIDLPLATFSFFVTTYVSDFKPRRHDDTKARRNNVASSRWLLGNWPL